MPLFFLFIILPVLELTAFIQVGAKIGVLWTLFWIFFSAFAGIVIIRLQGLTTLFHVRNKLAQGELPARELLRGFLMTMAGVLLVIPGFITDALGVLLLVPWVSAGLANYLLRHTGMFMPKHHYQAQRPYQESEQDNVIEGEFKRKD